MSLKMIIALTQNLNGVGTEIYCSGNCTKDEGELAQFIFDSITQALESRPGYKSNGVNVRVNNLIKEVNKNVH